MKKIISTLLLISIWISTGFSQDISIKLTFSDNDVPVGASGKVLVEVCNLGNVNLPSYKIRPLISIDPVIGVITGSDDLPAGWSICSGAGTSSIRLSNGTGILAPNGCVSFNLNFSGNSVLTEPSFVAGTATLGFASGSSGTSCNNGPQTVGNAVTNDNATSLIIFRNSLPVDLLSFKAVANGETSIALNWKTANEKNFSYFEVQKSVDGIEFGNIGTINGGGSSYYNFFDDKPNAGFNYYRLKMVDLNGTFKLSKIIVEDFNKTDKYFMVENPINLGLIKINTNYENPLFTLMASNGQKIEHVNQTKSGSFHIVKMPNTNYGIYFLTLESNGVLITKKLIFN